MHVAMYSNLIDMHACILTLDTTSSFTAGAALDPSLMIFLASANSLFS